MIFDGAQSKPISSRLPAQLLPHRVQHLYRIVRAVRVFLMLEERVGLQAIGNATSNPIDQLLQLVCRVAGLAKAKVDVAGGTDLGSVELLGFGDAQRRVPVLQGLVDFVAKPRLVTELECSLEVGRQQRQEVAQHGNIRLGGGRQLEEHRSQLRGQRLQREKESLYRLFDVL